MKYIYNHLNNRTSLHAAAYGNNVETLRILIKHGSNVNQEDNLGRTALIYSAMSGSKESFGT